MPDLQEQIQRLLDPILGSLGLTLWDLELRKQGPQWLLRIYIDRETDGVTLGDCEAVSRDLGTILDVEDVIPHSYTLEVSSPGLDRSLTRPEHYRRCQGSLVKIKTFQPINGGKVFRGKLVGLEDLVVVLEQDSGETLRIPLDNVSKASLEVVL
ncbi:MAG: ribosome maturation factor RimP [Nitrospirae bacterium]|nr:ribosome maturation factor RimP [Nitrospirota bacterium]